MSTTAALQRFWAKLERDRDGEVAATLSVLDHCADVAACLRALLASTLVRKRLAALAGLRDFDDVHLARLSVLAALHDIGKYNRGFQNRALRRPPFVAGHVRELLALWNATNGDGARLAAAVRIDVMGAWGEHPSTLEELLIAAIAHHGRPYMLDGLLVHDARLWRAGECEPISAIGAHTCQVMRWLPAAFEPGGSPLPASAALQHGLNGALTLADWLGSDTHFFPFDGPRGAERFAWAAERADTALRAIGLHTHGARQSLGARRPLFQDVFERSPRPMQQAVAELPLDADGSITVLESETGSGKTEAAIMRFLALYHAGLVDGMYFALPTRTAARQIHQRLRRAVERAFPDAAVRPPVILAVPGYIVADDRSARRAQRGDSTLAPFEVLWDDEDPDHWRARGWAAERPKRYLAGPIVVGTLDQALLSALTVPHSHLRAMSLARHLLVVDEVHASDAYMTRLMEDVVARHVRMQGHVLLMSATLGSAARVRLLLPGRGATPPEPDVASGIPYPVVMHRAAGSAEADVNPVASGRSRTVAIRLAAIAHAAPEIARTALDAARRGARVLVVRNTVRECVETQQAIEAATLNAETAFLLAVGPSPAPHHSRFAQPDREALDRALEVRFGGGSAPGGGIAIATQTVQQSLDIDADLLLTDLCPVDVLLQRLGRLHRHDARERPTGFEAPVAIVLTPPSRDLGQFLDARGRARGPHGIGTVYPDLTVLEATWRLAEQHAEWSVPAMCRRLVEHGTHPGVLQSLEAQLGGAWLAHGQATRGQYLAHRRLASLNLVSWDTPFRECEFPSGEMSREVRTRLGMDDRLAVFETALVSPFGNELRELTIPGHLVRGAAPDERPRDVDSASGKVRFRFGEQSFVYDRLGLRLFTSNEPDDDESDA